MEIDSTPAQDFGAGVQQHLHQPEHAGVVKFDARDFAAAAWNRQRETLEQGEINVHVERLNLKSGKAVSDGAEDTAYLIEIIETFVKAEILEIVAERLQPQEGRELLIHPHHRVLGVSAQHMMTMFSSLQYAGQLSADALVQAPAGPGRCGRH